MRLNLKQHSVLPGFGLSLGYTMTYLSLLVLIPLSALFLKTTSLSWSQFWDTVTSPRVLASYRLTFGAAFAAAAINSVLGFMVAWTLVRYPFPGKKFLDALVDLPFALPTAVSGITLTTIYAQNGWVGKYLEDIGIKVAFTPLGVGVAMMFIGLPFVIRTLQPAIEELDAESEDAAASLGATRWQTFRRVVLPAVAPAMITGFALAFARGLGEYGSIVFIAGNQPYKTEITPLLIMMKLDQHDYAGATAIAVTILCASFAILLGINGLQRFTGQAQSKGV